MSALTLSPEEVEHLLRETFDRDVDYWIEEETAMNSLRERALAQVEEEGRQERLRREQERQARREKLTDGLLGYLRANLGVDLEDVMVQVFDGPHDGPRAECEVDGIRFRYSAAYGRHEYFFVALRCCERCGGCASESPHLCDLSTLGRFLKQYPPLPASECPVCTPTDPYPEE